MRLAPRTWPARLLAGIALALLCFAGLASAEAGDDPFVVAVVGLGEDGRALEAAVDGARAAGDDVEVVPVDEPSWKAALRKAKAARPDALLVAREIDEEDFYRLTRRFRFPVYLLGGFPPDLADAGETLRHLGPTPFAEAVFAADLLLAPLSARRVGILHETTPWGRAVAAGVARNLSPWIALAGVETWPEGEGVAAAATVALDRLRALEADWIVLALRGAEADALARALEAAGEERALLFADGNRRASLLALAPNALARAVFVGGPDPEMEGHAGERLVAWLEREGRPRDVFAARAFDAVRGARGEPDAAVEALRRVRGFAFRAWRPRDGRLLPLLPAHGPTPGCGPPLGFRRVGPAEVATRNGRIGHLTWGDEDVRTIERDLLALGLSTSGQDAALDALVKEEILGRAIRIAHRLFRREADGTPIPGWSWGITFAVGEPPEDLPRRRAWVAIVAGDHEAAGGQVIGDGLVAVYASFLVRTMYGRHALDPPLSAADRPLLDGTWRWADDPARQYRADEIRCLLDGFASAVGLTLSHEFGHLCGCGHDTEHPTSIMNVVAGAGASWEEAVWIPDHRENLTRTLGLVGLR